MKSFAVLLFTLVPTLLFAADENASARIDEFLAAGYEANQIEPNPLASDETFLRRIYLDVIGRIPSIAEARDFLESKDANNRAILIDELLDSEGAVSHGFNFWADILRLSEYVGNNRLQTYAYSFWLKDSLRKNQPYDTMVHDLLTARGYIWENGATAYYHRDRGMPLDNMSNTVRIFLGTRMECAQCHDHPFDRWTQMDYYKMAAFSHTMDTRLHAPEGRIAVGEFQKEFYEKSKKKAEGGVMERKSRDYVWYRALNQVNADLFAFMKFILSRETPDTLTLPHDYQYSDAEPFDEVAPATMFGGEIKADSVENLVDAYADWMTSPDNPRFTKVITNRLWKRVMGHGLVEPVDEITDNTVASNPELWDFLIGRMKDLDYDMRAFMRDIYNTQAYQREAWTEEIPYGLPYHFPGPVMRRLSSEQLWDSMVTLAISEPDFYMPQMNLRLSQLDRIRQMHTSLESRAPAEFVDMAKGIASSYADTIMHVQELTNLRLAALADGDEEKAAEYAKELNGIRGKQRKLIHEMAHGDSVNGGKPDPLYGFFGIGGEHLPFDVIKKSLPRAPGKPGTDEQFTEWWALSKEFMRASELPFPAPRGHFLREFGQSDREAIQNSSKAASVPQALSLLNGPFAESLRNPNALLQIELDSLETSAEKLDALFLAVLSRHPSAEEASLFQDEMEKEGGAGILWVLLNSQQFRFLN